MGIVSGKSELKSPTSSWARACRAITRDVSMNAEVFREYVRTFESLLHVDCLLCAGLEVWDAALGLAKGLGPLG